MWRTLAYSKLRRGIRWGHYHFVAPAPSLFSSLAFSSALEEDFSIARVYLTMISLSDLYCKVADYGIFLGKIYPKIQWHLVVLSPSVLVRSNTLLSLSSNLSMKVERERTWCLTRHFRCVCARGEVSSSNKRKVALQILLLLPHTDHHNLPPSSPLRYRSSSSFSSTACSSSTAVSSASLPRNRAYLSLRSCKQSNSKLPAIVTQCERWRQNQARLWRLRKRKMWKNGEREGRETWSASRDSRSEGVNVFDHVCEKFPAEVEDRVRLKIDWDCQKITNETEEIIKNFVNVREHSVWSGRIWWSRVTVRSRNARRSRTFVIPVILPSFLFANTLP